MTIWVRVPVTEARSRWGIGRARRAFSTRAVGFATALTDLPHDRCQMRSVVRAGYARRAAVDVEAPLHVES